MIVWVGIPGATRMARFLLDELPARRLERCRQRIELALSYDLVPEQRDELIGLLAAGWSLRRALRHCRRAARRAQRRRRQRACHSESHD
jgi:hypothetical protein